MLQRRVQVLGHDMSEDELRSVLLEAMQKMLDTGGGGDGDEESGRRGWGWRNRLKADTQNLSAEELEAAAMWLVERFGHEVDSDEEEEETGDEGEEKDDGEVSTFCLAHVVRTDHWSVQEHIHMQLCQTRR